MEFVRSSAVAEAVAEAAERVGPLAALQKTVLRYTFFRQWERSIVAVGSERKNDQSNTWLRWALDADAALLQEIDGE